MIKKEEDKTLKNQKRHQWRRWVEIVISGILLFCILLLFIDFMLPRESKEGEQDIFRLTEMLREEYSPIYFLALLFSGFFTMLWFTVKIDENPDAVSEDDDLGDTVERVFDMLRDY